MEGTDPEGWRMASRLEQCDSGAVDVSQLAASDASGFPPPACLGGESS